MSLSDWSLITDLISVFEFGIDVGVDRGDSVQETLNFVFSDICTTSIKQ